MNNDNFLIERSDIELAQEICNFIEDSNLRSRAIANVIAAKIAKKYFNEIEIDVESGLHNISNILENFEISDIYIKDSYIDVRLYFEENGLAVPASHFKNKTLPVAYMFVKIDENISSATVSGFILPENIDISSPIQGYYQINEKDLTSFYDIEGYLETNYNDELTEEIEKACYDYLDKKLENESEFFKELLQSRAARIHLANVAKTKHIFNYISIARKDDVAVDTTSDEIEEEFIENSFENDTLEVLTEETDAFELNLANEEPVFELDTNDNNLEFSEIDSGSELLEIDDSSSISDFGILDENSPNIDTDTKIAESVDTNLDDNTDYNLNALDYSAETLDTDTNLVLEDQDSEFSDDYNSSQVDILTEKIIEEPEFTSTEENIAEYEEFAIDEANDEFEDTSVEKLLTDNTDQDDIVANASAPQESFETSDYEDNIEASDELTDFEFTTEITPSLSSVETTEEEDGIKPEDLDYVPDNTDDTNKYDTSADQDDATQIENLFGENPESNNFENTINQNNRSKALPILLTILLLGTAGYFGYTKLYLPNQTSQDVPKALPSQASSTVVKEKVSTNEVAMPIETLEEVNPQTKIEEETPSPNEDITEQNLDMSVLLSNLSLNWEVPTSYKSYASADRYFNKIGKIIQLNLKTEMLLLTKAPVTNKIAVELQFNKNSNKFEFKKFISSSGNSTIDSTVENIVKTTLNRNFNINLSSFGNLAGNPVLVIRL